MRVIWPFQPLLEMIEVLEWATDVLRAKAGEQRISMRRVPRRTFQLEHLFTGYQYSQAQALVREAQGADGFLVPDWPQSSRVGAVSSGSSVVVDVDLTYINMGDQALLWESPAKFEAVDITNDSNGVVLDSVTQDYTDARLIPLWNAEAPEGLSVQRMAGGIATASIAMVVDDVGDYGIDESPVYRGLSVLTYCQIVGSGTLDESVIWPVSVFGNATTISHSIRNRSIPDAASTLSFRYSTTLEKLLLRIWLHSRRGRQKAFWLSSFGKDLEPAASASSVATVLTVFAFTGLTGLGRTDPFDIEIKTATQSIYRRVTALTPGSPVSGRSTIDMTITALGIDVPLDIISRISFLRCTRLDSDRVELLHKAGEGMSVRVPCIEIPEP